MQKKFLFGVGISDVAMEEALEFITTSLDKSDKKLAIFTPNPEIVMFAQKNPEFKDIINTADLALNDGVGLSWAGQILGNPLKSRTTGVDFMLALCKEASEKGYTVGLFGGAPKIADRVHDCLMLKYPKLKIRFAVSEWKEDLKADILFVALGYPKQERWIASKLPRINVRVAMAVGGAFDYISGEVPRAPMLVRQIGFEWLFRLFVQPWRIRRQLALPQFVYAVLRERFARRAESSEVSG